MRVSDRLVGGRVARLLRYNVWIGVLVLVEDEVVMRDVVEETQPGCSWMDVIDWDREGRADLDEMPVADESGVADVAAVVPEDASAEGE